jgi:hypothetical protein
VTVFGWARKGCINRTSSVGRLRLVPHSSRVSFLTVPVAVILGSAYRERRRQREPTTRRDRELISNRLQNA